MDHHAHYEQAETNLLLSTLRVACNDRDYVLLEETLAALAGQPHAALADVPQDEHFTRSRVASARLAQCASGPPTPENLGALSQHLRAVLCQGVLGEQATERCRRAALQLDAMVRRLARAGAGRGGLPAPALFALPLPLAPAHLPPPPPLPRRRRPPRSPTPTAPPPRRCCSAWRSRAAACCTR
jgi:hypothetical protein